MRKVIPRSWSWSWPWLAALLLCACNGGERCEVLDASAGTAGPGQFCGPPIGGGGGNADAGFPYAACRAGLVCCIGCGSPMCQPSCAAPCSGSDCACGCPSGPFP